MKDGWLQANDFNNETIKELKTTIKTLQKMNNEPISKNELLSIENRDEKENEGFALWHNLINTIFQAYQHWDLKCPRNKEWKSSTNFITINALAMTNISENIVTTHRVPSFNKDRPHIILQFA